MRVCFSPFDPSHLSSSGSSLSNAELLATNLHMGLSGSGGHSISSNRKGRGHSLGKAELAKHKVIMVCNMQSGIAYGSLGNLLVCICYLSNLWVCNLRYLS